MALPCVIPEGYVLLDKHFDRDEKVKLKDLAWNMVTREWVKPTRSKYGTLGTVAEYWLVARLEK